MRLEQFPVTVLTFAGILNLLHSVQAKPKAKSNPEADPKAWDWQNEPHNLPVFSPYPFSKVSLETSRPSFLKINRNVSVMVGETAHLPCRVKNLDRYTVSWIRASDVTVLSVGHLAFSSDSRIGVVQVDRPLLSATDWNLSIEKSSKADDGLYECQVNTEPKINYKIFLSVSDPADAIQKDSPYYEVEDSKNNKKNRRDYEKTHSLVKKHHISQIDKEGFSMYLHDNGCICPRPQIVTQEKFRTSSFSGARVMPEVRVSGGPIHYRHQGEEVRLECEVTGLVAPPSVLLWTRDTASSGVLHPRDSPGMSLEVLRSADTSRASLYMRQVEMSDTGNYTCISDNQASTVLLVVTGSNVPGPHYLTQTSAGSPVLLSVLLLTSALLVSLFSLPML